MQKLMDSDELVAFLKEANINTYANKSVARVAASRQGSEDYHYEQGDLIFHDTYFGVRDYIGGEIVYKNRKPVWGMNYYGLILSEQTDERALYGFLRDALMQEYRDLIPVRGPRLFRAGEWRYTNVPDGEMARFTGSEEIHEGEQLLYRAYYHGGLLN